jgi:hypothetical protein
MYFQRKLTFLLQFEINRDDATALWDFLRTRERQSNDSCEVFATVNLAIAEPNEWSRVLHHGAVVAFFDVLLPLTSAVELAFAAYKLFCFLKTQGFSASVPVVFLTLHCVASVLRVVFLLVDPFGKRGIWPFGAWTILISITWPINLINTLLVSLFYRELNAGPMRMGIFLDDLQIPYVVVRSFYLCQRTLHSLIDLFCRFQSSSSLWSCWPVGSPPDFTTRSLSKSWSD